MSPPDNVQLVGAIIAKRYRLDRVVGRGGFAVVYQAHHLTLDTRVALKILNLVIPNEPSRRDKEILRFTDEARILARLRHPGIVAVSDAGVESSSGGELLPWIALEWCDGGTLADELRGRAGAPFSAAEAWSVVRAVALAVGDAHAASVAHRDLKPSNVMLARSAKGFEPRVVDFGIAKVFEAGLSGEEAATRGTLLCSPDYAAPEQIVGGATGPWTDIHALGLLLTELCVGRPPYSFTGAGPVAGTRPTPRAFGVDVGELEAVIARAVSLLPSDRFEDVEQLVAAGDELSLGEAPIRAPGGSLALDTTALQRPHEDTPARAPTEQATVLSRRAGPRGGAPTLFWPWVTGLGGLAVGVFLGALLTQKDSPARPIAPRPPSSATGVASSSSLEPTRRRLSDLDERSFQQRVAALGHPLKGAALSVGPELSSHVTLVAATGLATVFLVSVDSARLALKEADLHDYLLRRAHESDAPGMAFAIDGARALVVSAADDRSALELLDAVLGDLIVAQRGSRANPSPPPDGSSLEKLDLEELLTRVRRAGGQTESAARGGAGTFQLAVRRGPFDFMRVYYFRDAGVEQIAAVTKGFTGSVLVAVKGEAALGFAGSPALVEELGPIIVTGLDAQLRRPKR